MVTSQRCPVVDFDHNSPAHSADPPASYRRLRESAPVAYTEAHDGYYVLSDYVAVMRAARDDATFSSQRNDIGGEGLSIVIPKTPVHFHIPIELDPPEFGPWRKLVNPLTSPLAVRGLQPLIDHYVTWFVDEIIEAGEADLAEVIAVPSIITVDWVGLPVADWQTYSRAHRAALSAVPGSPLYRRAVEEDFPFLAEQMRATIAQRREQPSEDLISYFLAQEVEGRAVTDDEVFSIIDLIVAGGVGTTASLVSNTVVWLYQHQDVRRRLIDDPDLMDHAVEEFLRFFSPTQALARTTTTPTQVSGCPIPAGSRVLMSWASANRDATVFEDPDVLDIDRWPNRHMAFGVGLHRCAGSHLGRAMAKTLLRQLLERLPDYVVDLDALEPYPHQGTNTGWQRIPATFTPGPRRGTVHPGGAT